jgi:ubiquinone/menaquinone biosynthesis C-methylase UbiE
VRKNRGAHVQCFLVDNEVDNVLPEIGDCFRRLYVKSYVSVEMKASNEEVEIYDRFALDLARGADVVDRKSYDMIIDSRRKELLKSWLVGKSGLFLDYGCGDGPFSRFIKEELKTEVVGVDVSGGMVRYASTRGKGVNYLIADCNALPFKYGSFDAVVGMVYFII